MIRYLAEADVERCLPGPVDAVALARRALVALAHGRAELPPKASVHPRPDAFANSMPSYVADGDLLGLKWVAVYSANAGRGLPIINGLVLLGSGETGLPRVVMGAGAITGLRTAAVSGACIASLAPAEVGHVAITGAGVQTRSHLTICAGLGLHDVRVHARRPESARRLEAWAAEHTPDVRVTCVADGAAAIRGAGVVITGVPIGSTDARVDAALVRDDALLLPLDWSTSVEADLANPASLYSDEPAQLARVRADGHFAGYRDPDAYTGAAIELDERPAGRIVCQNLGIGAADLVFADAILATAEAGSVGTLLAR